MGPLRIVFIIMAGLALAAMLAVGMVVERTASVQAGPAVATQDVERALQLVRSHDPRQQRPGILRVVQADQRDVELLLDHAAKRWPGFAVSAQFQQGLALLKISAPMPWAKEQLWLNIDARLLEGPGLPAVQRLRFGSLPVPGWCAEPLMGWLLARRGWGVDTSLARDVVRRVDIRPGKIVVFYAWQDDTSQRLLAALVPLADQQRLRIYSDRLVELVAEEPVGSAVSLARLLPPLFERARQRTADGGDAALENRAAILTLAFYANQLGLSAIVPAARAWPRPRPLTVTLADRTDTPLHYLISAAIAAEAGSPLADAVGLYKENADSRGGSGFSFNDLAADRAGTRFGDLAVREPERAQRQLSAHLNEPDLLPDVSDLPEALSASEFSRRFGAVGAPAYRRLLAEIEARLDRLPLLR